VAAALRVPEGTVKSRLARARDALRRALAPTLGSAP
jgi:DNA-directed RNA polymerase specialized sigma24 family protein